MWRHADYVRARDALVARGEALVSLLKSKAESKNGNERLFATILRARIENPNLVEKWNKDLAFLVKDRDVLEAARKYQDFDWSRLPTKPVDLPPSHLVDVLWEHAHGGSIGERQVTAVAIQFYLRPDMEALDAVIESVPFDHALARMAKAAIVKLGPQSKPRMREVLTKTIAMQPSVPWGSSNMTREQRDGWHKYWRQTSRARVAAYVLSRLDNRDCIPLMAKCLTGPTTDHTYSEEISEYLSYMKAVEAAESMLDCTLKSAVNRWYKGNGERPGYVALRSHVLDLGKEVLPVLQERLKASGKDGERVTLVNLIAELSGVQGREKEVAEIRESLWFDTTTANLLRLHELTDEDIFPRLCELLLGGPRRVSYRREAQIDERIAACLAVGALKETRAVPILAEEIRKQHESLEKELSKRKTGEDANPFDPQTAREAGYTFGEEATWFAQVLSWGDTCLLALRRIGGEEARQALIQASTCPEYKIRAEISLLLLDGKDDEMVKNLASDRNTLREEAALALLENKDGRATREILCAAARRHGPNHTQWKEYALSSREDITPALRDLARSGNAREQVLADAMLIELESPEEAKKTQELLHDAASHVSMMHVQTIGMVEGAGRVLAKKIERTHVPLVEAVCAFGQGVIRRGVAAYALAEFKQPRSMHVLAESLNMGSLGGSNPAALALADYGEKGIELAAKVPAPTPGEHDTGLRMTNHRGGVQVLAEHKDIRGVDEILKGLATLEKDKSLSMWNHRMGIYLGASGKFHDKRLVDPLLRVLATSERPESSHHNQVIQLLSAYDDSRLVPLFTERLGTLNPQNDYPARDTLYGAALTALTCRLGEKTPEYLIDQFNKSNNDSIRSAVLLALGELSYPNAPAFPGEERWSVERFNNKEDRERVASEVRRLGFPVLVKGLKDRSVGVNRMAALGLTIMATGSQYVPSQPDLRAIEPLNEWCKAKSTSFFALTRYLGDQGNEESGEVLLGVLRSQPPEKGDAHIVDAIAKLKPKGAIAILDRNIRGRASKCERWYQGEGRELEALVKFGEDGKKALLGVLNSVDNYYYKVRAAHLLAEVGSKDAASPIAGLLQELLKAGPNSSKLIPGYNEDRPAAYERSCSTVLQALLRVEAPTAKRFAEQILLEGPESLTKAALKVWSEK